MKARYYSKSTKNEVLEGIHFNLDSEGQLPEDIVELPEGHFFLSPLPPGKKIGYDENDMPVLEDLVIPPTSPETITSNLREAALARQHQVGFDVNFTTLLGLAELKGQGAGGTAPKASACIAAIDTIWGEYEVRKTGLVEDYDFSAFGSKPHSYDDVKLEFNGS